MADLAEFNGEFFNHLSTDIDAAEGHHRIVGAQVEVEGAPEVSLVVGPNGVVESFVGVHVSDLGGDEFV